MSYPTWPVVINTVLGPIEELGVTLVHEHLLLDGKMWWIEPVEPRYKKIAERSVTLENVGLVRRAGLYSRDNLVMEDPRVALSELKDSRVAGGRTVVDLTTEGLGRNPKVLRWLSEKSKVNIITCTGYYVEETHPRRIKKQSMEEIADSMVNEITNGIGSTGIKAAVIGEIGVSPGKITQQERKVLKAAAKAQSEAHVPLTVHMWGDPPGMWPGLQVLDLIQSSDADLGKVYLSHVDWTMQDERDWLLLRKAAARGVYLSFDNFGNEWPASTQYHPSGYLKLKGAPTDSDRLKGIRSLAEEGYADRILVSQDLSQKIHLKKYGGHGLNHILTNVPNLFKMFEMSSDLLRKFTVDNPGRLFH